MAVKTFYPTWIATYNRTTGNQYKVGEPVVSDNQYLTLIGFDTAEMLKAFVGATNLKIFLNFTTDRQVNYGELAFHYVQSPTTSISFINYASMRSLQTTTAGTKKIDITSYQIGTTFQDFLNSGAKGLVIQHGKAEQSIFNATNFHITFEGTWYPYAPTPQYPVGGVQVDRTKPISLIWRHEGGSIQNAYQVRYRQEGLSTWTTISQESSDGFYTIPENMLATGSYEWQVRTSVEGFNYGPWSELSIFNVADMTNAPTITHPTPGMFVEVQDLFLEWESVQNQVEVEVEIITQLETGSIPIVISRHFYTNENSVNIPQVLMFNNQNYTIRLRVRADGQIWSDWAEINITTDYTMPAKPSLVFVKNEETQSVTVHIENPEPTGTEPNVVSQDLYRRCVNGDWVKIAKDLESNSQFIDFSIGGDSVYEYRVMALGENGVWVTSDEFSISIEIKDAVLSRAINPAEFVRLKWDPQRSFHKRYNATKMKFVGRKRPITEFGEPIEFDGNLSFLVSKNDLHVLDELATMQETLIYRDSRKRKHYVTIESISVEDVIQFLNYFRVQITLMEVDYKEGVSDD